MRKLVSCILLVALLCGMTTAFAAYSGDPIIQYNTPVLITNAGQGPGGKMARLLMTQTGTITLGDYTQGTEGDFYYSSEPGRDMAMAEELQRSEYSCLIVVMGSTDKGLGASGISIDDEIARLEEMVATAEEIELPIIAVLLEKDKRSDISTNANERCIDTICPHADWMIVVADGNTDGRFDALKEEYGIPLTILDTSMDFTALAKEAFVKAEPAA